MIKSKSVLFACLSVYLNINWVLGDKLFLSRITMMYVKMKSLYVKNRQTWRNTATQNSVDSKAETDLQMSTGDCVLIAAYAQFTFNVVVLFKV